MLAFQEGPSWYVARALRGTGPQSRRARLRYLVTGVVAGSLAVGLLACGGGGERQDAAEPAGTFPVEIVTSEFPPRQRLAETSLLRLGVRNTGDEALPTLAITISIGGPRGRNSIRPFSIRDPQPGLALPDRPVWILENGWPRLAGSAAPAGAQTANDKTFAFGALKPGDTTEAVWKLTSVQAGKYILRYEVDAGLTGKAKAETAGGGRPSGSFAIQISDVPPQTRVNDKGQVVQIEGGTLGAPPGSGSPSGGTASGDG